MPFVFSKVFFKAIGLLLMMHAEYLKTENISTGKFVRRKTRTPFVKDNDSFTSDNLTSVYYTSGESPTRCARRCMNDEMCAAFDVRRNDDFVANTKCALMKLKVLTLTIFLNIFLYRLKCFWFFFVNIPMCNLKIATPLPTNTHEQYSIISSRHKTKYLSKLWRLMYKCMC